MFKTMTELKDANKEKDGHWFDRDSMKFFNSKIESSLLKGGYFITSEKFDNKSPRLFSVRKTDDDANISTIGEFQGYRSKTSAKEAIKNLQEEKKKCVDYKAHFNANDYKYKMN